MPPPCDTINDGKQSGPLSVLEVSDPKLCILAHLMSPLEPIDPHLESPTAHPIMKQRACASELLCEVCCLLRFDFIFFLSKIIIINHLFNQKGTAGKHSRWWYAFSKYGTKW